MRAVASQAFRNIAAEERLARLDAARGCCPTRRDRGVDAEHAHSVTQEILEQIAVVAADLDDQGICGEVSSCDDVGGVPLRMTKHRVGVRREIRVVGEQDVGRDRVGELYERAARTDRQVEWIAGLRGAQPTGAEQRVGQRGRAERQNEGEAGLTT